MDTQIEHRHTGLTVWHTPFLTRSQSWTNKMNPSCSFMPTFSASLTATWENLAHSST